jgi:hypothetical protein
LVSDRIRIRMWIRIQGFDDQKCKTYSWKKNLFLMIKIPIYVRTSRLQKKPHPTKKNIQYFKQYRTFLNFFHFLWVIFAHLDPDPHSQCGSGPGSSRSTSVMRIRIHNTVCRYRNTKYFSTGLNTVSKLFLFELLSPR